MIAFIDTEVSIQSGKIVDYGAVRDNGATANVSEPLSAEEQKALGEAMRIYRESAPIPQSEIDQYKGLLYHGVPVTAILQAYSICQIQPDPGFSDDNNYLKNAFAEAEHVDFREGLTPQQVIATDGTDITAKVEEASRRKEAER